MVDGQVQSCKVPTCSCIDGHAIVSNELVCSADILNIIPEKMKNISNCNNTSGLVCVNCPPDVNLNKDNNSIDLNNITDNDLIVYKCNTNIPSYFDTIGDLIQLVL